MTSARVSELRMANRALVVTAALATVVAAPSIAANAAVTVAPPVASTLVSAAPVDTTPHAQNGDVRAFAQVGSTVYAGGSFTGVKSPGAAAWTPRAYLIAYDRTTGAVDTTFAPQLDGTVSALAVNGDGTLIVGGAFSTVNGVARKGLVALDPVTGATVASFAGRADGGVVRRTIVSGQQLYVAGAFHWINGTAHSLLARLDARTGAVDPTFQIDASVARAASELVWALALSPDRRTLVATGNFTVVNGLPRNQVVMVDVSGPPTVANWRTERFAPPCASAAFAFYARDVDFSDDGTYFVIAADGGREAGAYCDAISRWETSARGSGLDATWVQDTGRDSVTAVEAADNVVYVGGHFRWLNNAGGNDSAGPGAVDRYGLGALDPGNGMPLAWNPSRSPGSSLPAGGTAWGAIVWELWKGPDGLFIGQDSDGLGQAYHGRLALLPTAGGRSLPVVDAPPGSAGYLYLGAGATTLTKVPISGSALGAPAASSQPNLVSPRAAFVTANRLVWAQPDSSAPSGSNLNVAIIGSTGTIGAPWIGSGFNAWFDAAALTGAFYLSGRMYYTTADSADLRYRYFEPDGNVVGCTAFAVPTLGVDWRSVRGMTWVNGTIVYGSTSGTLRSVTFDPTAATGRAVDGAAAAVLATAATGPSWSTPTLYFNPR